MDPVEDEGLIIAAARGGDGEAFARLVRRHQEVAFRAAYLIVRDAGAAEDVAQEAFVRAFRGLGSFREGEPFRPWLLRIVTNLALNEVRGRNRRQGLFARITSFRQDPEPSPEPAALEGEQRDAVWRAIHELNGDDQVVLYLRYYLDLSEAEIAGVIGRPAGTVKSRLHRAGGRLREVVENRYPELRPTGKDVRDA